MILPNNLMIDCSHDRSREKHFNPDTIRLATAFSLAIATGAVGKSGGTVALMGSSGVGKSALV